jgi:hypothetical protein
MSEFDGSLAGVTAATLLMGPDEECTNSSL